MSKKTYVLFLLLSKSNILAILYLEGREAKRREKQWGNLIVSFRVYFLPWYSTKYPRLYVSKSKILSFPFGFPSIPSKGYVANNIRCWIDKWKWSEDYIRISYFLSDAKI